MLPARGWGGLTCLHPGSRPAARPARPLPAAPVPTAEAVPGSSPSRHGCSPEVSALRRGGGSRAGAPQAPRPSPGASPRSREPSAPPGPGRPPGSPLKRPQAGSGSRGAAGLTCKPPLPDVPPEQVPGFGGGVPQLLAQRPPELRLGGAALAAHPRQLRMLPRAAPLSAGGRSPRRGRAAAATWGRGAASPRRSPRHRRSGRAAPSPERRPARRPPPPRPPGQQRRRQPPPAPRPATGASPPFSLFPSLRASAPAGSGRPRPPGPRAPRAQAAPAAPGHRRPRGPAPKFRAPACACDPSFGNGPAERSPATPAARLGSGRRPGFVLLDSDREPPPPRQPHRPALESPAAKSRRLLLQGQVTQHEVTENVARSGLPFSREAVIGASPTPQLLPKENCFFRGLCLSTFQPSSSHSPCNIASPTSFPLLSFSFTFHLPASSRLLQQALPPLKNFKITCHFLHTFTD